MDDVRLAALEHHNLIEAMAFVCSGVEGAVVRRGGGVALIASGLPVRLFNQLLVDADDATPEAIAEAVATLRRRGSPFVVNLRMGPDDAIVPVVRELGLVQLSTRPWMPGMALHPLSAGAMPVVLSRAEVGEQGPTDGHEIRLVADQAGLDDHVRAASIGFEMDEALVRTIMAGAMQPGDDVAIYVGYTDDEPVTSGLGVRTGRTIGVYNIATVPWARRRGLAQR